jgi:hypothetical protein
MSPTAIARPIATIAFATALGVPSAMMAPGNAPPNATAANIRTWVSICFRASDGCGSLTTSATNNRSRPAPVATRTYRSIWFARLRSIAVSRPVRVAPNHHSGDRVCHDQPGHTQHGILRQVGQSWLSASWSMGSGVPDYLIRSAMSPGRLLWRRFLAAADVYIFCTCSRPVLAHPRGAACRGHRPLRRSRLH